MNHDSNPTRAAARLVLPWIACILIAGSGCRICASCEDEAYPAYGGAWQRTIRDHGRVGSVFAPAGGKVASLVDKDTPLEPDELERQRRQERGDLDEADDSASDDLDGDADESDDRPSLKDVELEDLLEPGGSDLREKDLDDIEIRLIPVSPRSPGVS